jgi:hypothetical protein
VGISILGYSVYNSHKLQQFFFLHKLNTKIMNIKAKRILYILPAILAIFVLAIENIMIRIMEVSDWTKGFMDGMAGVLVVVGIIGIIAFLLTLKKEKKAE